MHAPAQGLGFRASVSTCIMHHPPLVGWSTSRPRGCRCPHRGTGPRHCIRQGHRRCKLPPRRCQSGCMRCRHRSTRHSPGGRHIQNTAHHQGLHQGGVAHPSLQYAPFTWGQAHRQGDKNGTPPWFQNGPIVSGGTPIIVVPIREGWHTRHRGPHQRCSRKQPGRNRSDNNKTET